MNENARYTSEAYERQLLLHLKASQDAQADALRAEMEAAIGEATALATDERDGLMSKEDKRRLRGVQTAVDTLSERVDGLHDAAGMTSYSEDEERLQFLDANGVNAAMAVTAIVSGTDGGGHLVLTATGSALPAQDTYVWTITAGSTVMLLASTGPRLTLTDRDSALLTGTQDATAAISTGGYRSGRLPIGV